MSKRRSVDTLMGTKRLTYASPKGGEEDLTDPCNSGLYAQSDWTRFVSLLRKPPSMRRCEISSLVSATFNGKNCQLSLAK